MENMVVVQRDIAKMLGISSKDNTLLETSEYRMFFDGCSKGNPGPGGAGAVIYKGDDEISSSSVYVGDKITNNHAEYLGLITGLEMAVGLGIEELQVCGDSQLVIKQMRGEYKVNHPTLIIDHKTAKELAKKITTIDYRDVPRKENSRADELANLGLLQKPLPK
jgi:ribonuclease HI